MADRPDIDESLLEFPCEFPVKILGRADEDFVAVVIEIVRRHAPGMEADRVSTRSSRDGNFVAVTCTIIADSRGQLDALYEELSTHERVLMAL